MAILDDQRQNKTSPWGFVIFEDTFLSGWGYAEGGISYFVLEVDDAEEAKVVIANGVGRDDMADEPLVVNSYADVEALAIGNNHVSIRDREEASRWYEPGAW